MMTRPESSAPGAMSRRTALGGMVAAFGAGVTTPLRSQALFGPGASGALLQDAGSLKGRIYKSLKIGMVRLPGSFEDKLKKLEELGYDGLELNSPGGVNLDEAVAASRKTGFPLHGVVDSVHWKKRLSDQNPEVREQGYLALKGAVRDASRIGGSSVLLVPGRVANADTENQQQVWDRSIEQIRRVLPLASRLGIHILIENVWNGFCYLHEGPSDQSADQLAAYLDAIDSPWVGAYFDIGNHQKYGKPAQWIRRLGRRIVKLDVKDWGVASGFCKIGDGDVDWPEVRKALLDIGYCGWATAEVGGGKEERLREVSERMDRVFAL